MPFWQAPWLQESLAVTSQASDPAKNGELKPCDCCSRWIRAFLINSVKKFLCLVVLLGFLKEGEGWGELWVQELDLFPHFLKLSIQDKKWDRRSHCLDGTRSPVFMFKGTVSHTCGCSVNSFHHEPVLVLIGIFFGCSNLASLCTNRTLNYSHRLLYFVTPMSARQLFFESAVLFIATVLESITNPQQQSFLLSLLQYAMGSDLNLQHSVVQL